MRGRLKSGRICASIKGEITINQKTMEIKEADKFPTIQLITRQKNANIFALNFGRSGDLRDLIETNPLPELQNGKNGYLKITSDGKVFFDSNLKPDNFEIYKITHIAGNDHSWRNFINQEEFKVPNFIKENKLSIMNFPLINEVAKIHGRSILNSFKKSHYEKFMSWHWEKNKESPAKISSHVKEVFEFADEQAKKTLETEPERKVSDILSDFLLKPLKFLKVGEWALELTSYRILKGFYKIFYQDKDYKHLYKTFEPFVESSIDQITINNEPAVRVYGHNGLYLYQLYWDILHGDFCKKCGRFLETPLTLNGNIQKNRRVYCDKSDSSDCYRKRKTENQKRSSENR
jgi:hypothetical protein